MCCCMSMLYFYSSASWFPPVNACNSGAINKSGQARPGSNCWTDDYDDDDAAAFWRVNSTSPSPLSQTIALVALELGKLGAPEFHGEKDGTFYTDV